MATIGEVYRRNMPETVEISCQSSSRSGSEELHVLAVDDSHVDRKVIERLLKISSCRVTVVESGTRALQYLGLDGETKSSVGFDGLKVNMIMTDYSMPGMTGYELLKKIKESSAFREIPVVIMSSENIMTRIDRCLEEGAEEFIVKPVKLADVKRLTDFIMKGDGEKIGGVEGNHKRKLQDMYVHLSSSPSPSPSPSPSSSLSPSQSSSPSSSLSELQSPPPSSSLSPSQSSSPSSSLSELQSPSPPPSSSLSPSQSSSPSSSLSELQSPSPPPSSSLSPSQSSSPSSSLSELQSPLPPPSSSLSPSPSPSSSLSSSSCACDLSPPPSAHSPSKWHRLRNWH